MSDSKMEAIAKEKCAKLLETPTGKTRSGRALIMVAFAYGAAWALDAPEMIDLGDAQIEANRTPQQ